MTKVNGSIRRTARKQHKCGCGRVIEPGDIYLIHVDYPGSGIGYGDDAGHPVRMPECAYCAMRYGRADWLVATPLDKGGL